MPHRTMAWLRTDRGGGRLRSGLAANKDLYRARMFCQMRLVTAARRYH